MCSKQGLTRWYPFLSDNAVSFIKIGRKALDPPSALARSGRREDSARGSESPDRNERHFPLPHIHIRDGCEGKTNGCSHSAGVAPAAVPQGPIRRLARARAELCLRPAAFAWQRVGSGEPLRWSPGVRSPAVTTQFEKSCLEVVCAARARGWVPARPLAPPFQPQRVARSR